MSTGLRPAIVLSEPQLGENIGACARAMKNFGLSDLRLIAPRHGWPNPRAEAMAVGAADLIHNASIHDSTRSAIGGLKLVFAATGRERAMAKPVLTPSEAVRRLREAGANGVETGLLFGNERAGLTNDEVALADAIVTIPTDPTFASINLGQAALILCYEWFKAEDTTPSRHRLRLAPATRGCLLKHPRRGAAGKPLTVDRDARAAPAADRGTAISGERSDHADDRVSCRHAIDM